MSDELPDNDRHQWRDELSLDEARAAADRLLQGSLPLCCWMGYLPAGRKPTALLHVRSEGHPQVEDLARVFSTEGAEFTVSQAGWQFVVGGDENPGVYSVELSTPVRRAFKIAVSATRDRGMLQLIASAEAFGLVFGGDCPHVSAPGPVPRGTFLVTCRPDTLRFVLDQTA